MIQDQDFPFLSLLRDPNMQADLRTTVPDVDPFELEIFQLPLSGLSSFKFVHDIFQQKPLILVKSTR